MKIVVTGALGHIGSYVIRDLAVQFPNEEIVLIDNMMTQRFPSLFNLPAEGNYHFIEGDVTDMDLNTAFSDTNVVIHLAAITDAAGSFDRVEELETNNYQSTVKVANACAETGASLIAISSTSVYVYPSLVPKAVLVIEPLVNDALNSNVYVEVVANVAGVIFI